MLDYWALHELFPVVSEVLPQAELLEVEQRDRRCLIDAETVLVEPLFTELFAKSLEPSLDIQTEIVGHIVTKPLQGQLFTQAQRFNEAIVNTARLGCIHLNNGRVDTAQFGDAYRNEKHRRAVIAILRTPFHASKSEIEAVST